MMKTLVLVGIFLALAFIGYALVREDSGPVTPSWSDQQQICEDKGGLWLEDHEGENDWFCLDPGDPPYYGYPE